jgi:hypothetical protein
MARQFTWRLIGALSLCLAALVACRFEGQQAGPFPVLPSPSPLQAPGRGPVLPIPEGLPSSPSASPSPFPQLPFAFPFPPGPRSQLCVFDRPRLDVLPFPGTGPGIENTFTLNPGQYYYDDHRDVLLYDAWQELQIKLVDGREVGGFAFAPAFDSNYHLYFLGTSDPKLATQGLGFAYLLNEAAATPGVDVASPVVDVAHYATSSWAPSVTVPPQVPIIPRLIKPYSLTKINAVAALHGGINTITPDGNNDAVVFSTGDGGLYLYTPPHPQVYALLPDELIDNDGGATGAVIDPIWGRYVVWQEIGRQSLLVLDRWTGQIDTAPYILLAPDIVSASAPFFEENDPYSVIFTLTQRNGTTRIAVYNILTEQLLNLTVLNAFP